jgi:orotidine-5'-phosphate decarboxylase
MTAEGGFLDRLQQTVRQHDSLLCIGLDPELEKLPEPLRGLPPEEAIVAFNREIVNATADVAAGYKPNLAFYEALGPAGMQALRRTVELIPPGTLVVGDAKRGDIDNTMRLYARALFDVYGFGAVTVSPYLGRDALEPFLSRRDRGIFILCRTSNPGAGEIVNLPVDLSAAGGPNGAMEGKTASSRSRPLFLAVAERVRTWNEHKNAGLVVGATFPQELAQVREVCPDLPILLPGVGAQQGDLEASVRAGLDAAGSGLLVVSARQVLYASSGADFATAARRTATTLRDRINRMR